LRVALLAKLFMRGKTFLSACLADESMVSGVEEQRLSNQHSAGRHCTKQRWQA